ncbi:TRAP transporter substrate-binding protein [Cetobacterium sp. ZWU0022]|uniref:TRAP transporter substrate-binding protein n=1 Tax=Cetobacterium sp. ZWU0022 TaxID=1340502 RepID=UPI00064554BF|nr:TRAP transporter substrate-binding protein [Cetobacterium sp. ZWU0022]
MKKIISFLVLALTILTGCGKSEGGSSKKIKLAHALTESHPVHLAMVEFGKEVNEKTNGDIEVLIFPNGQLGGEREITELMQAGAIDIIKTNAGPLESFAQEYSILSLPYLFRDMDHHLRVVKSEIGEEILAATIDRGFIGLTFYNSGTRNFYTKRPVKNTEDLKGLKIRVQTSKTMVRMTNLLGGSPSPLSFGEIYTALQQGVVDGAENNLVSYAESKHYETAPYFVFDEHSISPDVLVMNTKAWDKLNDEERAIVKQAALNSYDYQNKIWFETEDKLVDSLKENGVQFFEVDKTEFIEKVQPLYNEVMTNELVKSYVEKIRNFE